MSVGDLTALTHRGSPAGRPWKPFPEQLAPLLPLACEVVDVHCGGCRPVYLVSSIDREAAAL